MNWKVFITACVSTAMVSFPQNIIGCGGETNPYDYYTSFFHNNLPDAKAYRPFYYTGYNFLYDDKEPVSVADLLSDEWAGYCGAPVSRKDAFRFVNKFAWKDLNNLYYNIEKNQPLKLPDSVKASSMTDYFLQKKDLEALGYIMYAKKAEPFVSGDAWYVPERDSIKMDKLLKNGQQLYAVAKNDLIRLKYAYQVLRLAHYSGRYQDVLRLYDEYKPSAGTSSEIVSQLCLALKAGALFRTGQTKESAYLFSKVFAATSAKRISNYLGFVWSYKNGEDRKNYLSLCRNDVERANMLGMFALSSSSDELAAMKEIYSLDPANEMLDVLAVREINKLEEKYLTPTLQKQPGGLSFYYYYAEGGKDSVTQTASKEVKELSAFMHTASQSGKLTNSGLFGVGAAYASYMIKDFSNARKYIGESEKLQLTPKVNDQLMLTNLLLTISEKNSIDKDFEEQLLPSIRWLKQKAQEEKPLPAGYWEVNQWADFYRNLMTDILAKRYHQQNDLQKEVLCVGAAENVNPGYTQSAISFLRNKFSSTDVEKMFTLMESKQLNAFEKYLIGNNSIQKSDVIDFAGTAYLRDYNYAKAVEWFNKTADKKTLAINTKPFIDLLYDQESRLPAEAKFATSKLAFAQDMQKLLQLASTDKVDAARHYYKYALGLYNITYYGHAWQLVAYDRSGSDGYYIPKDATAFQKEYYGAFTALQYFEKAMNTATDKNFKARCLFMMAKCIQKQIRQPRYDDYTGDNSWEKMEADNKLYWPRFKNNQYFPKLVKEYGTTAFYKAAFSSCSYLRDFVRKK